MPTGEAMVIGLRDSILTEEHEGRGEKKTSSEKSRTNVCYSSICHAGYILSSRKTLLQDLQ